MLHSTNGTFSAEQDFSEPTGMLKFTQMHGNFSRRFFCLNSSQLFVKELKELPFMIYSLCFATAETITLSFWPVKSSLTGFLVVPILERWSNTMLSFFIYN